MSHVDEALKRTHIQHIREFIFYGLEATKIDNAAHKDRLRNSTSSMYSRLQKLYPDKDEQEDAINDFNHALSVYSDVYIEIGIRIGAKLLHELLLSNTAPESK